MSGQNFTKGDLVSHIRQSRRYGHSFEGGMMVEEKVLRTGLFLRYCGQTNLHGHYALVGFAGEKAEVRIENLRKIE